MILLFYVDDLFMIGDEKLIVETKKKLVVELEMKDLDMMHYFVGVEVWQNPDEIFLSQGKYAVDILNRFRMMDCNSIATLIALNLKLMGDTTLETVNAIVYREIIGSLMYLTNTRQDI